MASAFSHIAVPVVLYAAARSKTISPGLFLLAALVSVLPDADVIAFKFGIPYESQWGHRGFTHSVVFAVCLAALISLFHKNLKVSFLAAFCVCFISCLSHALLDAMTNGGLGVALYWPLNNERVFFPFRPIQVSPIGIGSFFSEKGLKVIMSELQWVLFPAAVLSLVAFLVRRKFMARVPD